MLLPGGFSPFCGDAPDTIVGLIHHEKMIKIFKELFALHIKLKNRLHRQFSGPCSFIHFSIVFRFTFALLVSLNVLRNRCEPRNLNRITVFYNCSITFAISIADSAAFAPALPILLPALSTACSRVSQVSTPNMAGVSQS